MSGIKRGKAIGSIFIVILILVIGYVAAITFFNKQPSLAPPVRVAYGCTAPVPVGQFGGDSDIENNFIAYYLSLPPYGLRGLYSGNDSKFGTVDDITVTLANPISGTLQSKVRVEGKNIVWWLANLSSGTIPSSESVKLLNNGPDNTFGTADDIGPITVFTTSGTLASSMAPLSSGPYIRKNLVSFVETLGSNKNVYWCATDNVNAGCFNSTLNLHMLASNPSTQIAIGVGDSSRQQFVWDKTGGITNGDIYYNDNSNFSARYIVENTTDDEMLRDFDGDNVLFQHTNINTAPMWATTLNLGKAKTPNTKIPISPQYFGLSILSPVLSSVPYNGRNLVTWHNVNATTNGVFVGGANMAPVRISTFSNGQSPRIHGNRVSYSDYVSVSSYGVFYSECNA